MLGLHFFEFRLQTTGRLICQYQWETLLQTEETGSSRKAVHSKEGGEEFLKCMLLNKKNCHLHHSYSFSNWNPLNHCTVYNLWNFFAKELGTNLSTDKQCLVLPLPQLPPLIRKCLGTALFCDKHCWMVSMIFYTNGQSTNHRTKWLQHKFQLLVLMHIDSDGLFWIEFYFNSHQCYH